ncbi:hypothetical protein HPULCUR_003744 [Helicostylum pulchrum]|uniref:Uncharacterized protein n=1 Tax=Helicostylum pulchrum TaxID=562976 RepID=A0ABP9XU88_9FUNG
MKSFYLSMSKDLKKSIVSQDMNSQLEGLITLNDEADVNRNTYDLVYFKSNKKRPASAQAVALKLLAHSMTIESPRVDPEH